VDGQPGPFAHHRLGVVDGEQPPGGAGLVSLWLGVAAARPAGRGGGQELRYYGRDPRARAGTLIVVIFALALPIVVAISGWGRQPESVLAVGVLAAWVGLGAINQYGIEAGAYCGLGRRRRGPPGGQEPGVRRVGPRRGDASGPGPGGRDRRVALGASGRAHQRGRPGRGPGGGQRGLCPCSWPPWYWGWVLLWRGGRPASSWWRRYPCCGATGAGASAWLRQCAGGRPASPSCSRR
jgi:hypothetical protein